jgi:CRISPR-associated protein Cas5d
MNDDSLVRVKVWGRRACFTRPEWKVERATYEVITPSAARGLLDAIYWHPPFSWEIREIWVLNPIRTFSVVRNEVTNRASFRAATQRVEGASTGYVVDTDRTLRYTRGLKDVAYLIVAEPVERPGYTGDIPKYLAMFRRRLQQGQCFFQPYFGCREFAAYFAPPQGDEQPQPYTLGLDRMLFDFVTSLDGNGRIVREEPRFFQARLEGGILRIPQELYHGLYRQGGSHGAH